MYKTSLRLSAAAILGMVAAPAFAGGLAQPVFEPAPYAPQPAPMVMAPTGWGGFYLGGQIGLLEAEETDDLTPDLTVDFESNIYGIHAGYNVDFGNFVLGGEVDYDIFEVDEVTITGTAGSADFPADGDGSILRAKLRGGYNFGSFMPYGTAGVARLTLEDNTPGGTTDDTDGYYYGAGLSYKATENILIGGELLRHEFDDAFDADGVDIQADTLTLRGSYRF